MQPCLSPSSVSLREIAAMICGGERRVCLTACGKHNGSIHQEQPGRRTVGAEEEMEGRGRLQVMGENTGKEKIAKGHVKEGKHLRIAVFGPN